MATNKIKAKPSIGTLVKVVELLNSKVLNIVQPACELKYTARS